MPTIIGDLGGLAHYAWVFSIYLLTATVAMPVYGRLADIHGRRRSPSHRDRRLPRAPSRALSRSRCPSSSRPGRSRLRAPPDTRFLAVAADIDTLQERGRVQGLFSSVWGSAALVGPLLGALLTVHFGWRSIFSINLPLGAVALFLVTTRMIESRARLPDPWTWPGPRRWRSALRCPARHPAAPRLRRTAAPLLRVSALLAGAASLAVFARIQTRREHPLSRRQLFKHWDTASPYLAGILLGTTVSEWTRSFRSSCRGPGAARPERRAPS